MTRANKHSKHKGQNQWDPWEELIPHIFLPLKLPQQQGEIVELESELLSQWSNLLEKFLEVDCCEFVPDRKRNQITATFGSWLDIQSQENPDPKKISSQIENLLPGESFGFYIRCQNTGILINVMEEGTQRAYVSTFPASQKSDTVTTALRPLVGIFPTTSVTVPNNPILSSLSFSRQLGSLTSEPIREARSITTKASSTTVENREVPDTFYVSKWLIATLMDDKSSATSHVQVPKLQKKVRDNVQWNDGALLPWRRSGCWMVIKVITQIILCQHFREQNGTILYKMLMVKFMLTFLKEIENHIGTPTASQIGLFMEMMGKIARRSHKLQSCFHSHLDHDSSLDGISENLMEEAANLLQGVRTRIKTSYWTPTVDNSSFRWNIPDLPKVSSLIHPLDYRKSSGDLCLIDYLESKKYIFNEIGKKLEPQSPVKLRHVDHGQLFPFGILGQAQDLNQYGQEAVGMILLDFEKNVDSWPSLITASTEQDAVYVWTQFQDYLGLGKSYYARDPVGFSRMILVSLQIVHLWDSLLLRQLPLLAEHRPGIQNLEFIQHLLLPELHQMSSILQIEHYFDHRLNSAHLPSLVEEDKPSFDSFAVRYVNTNTRPEMITTRNRILQFGEDKVKAKLQELAIMRKRAERLLAEYSSLECEFILIRWRRVHSRTCVKCAKFKLYKNLLVEVYEHPLPNNTEEQNAVVFELMIPTPLAVLRDLYFLFQAVLSGGNEGVKSSNLYGPWTDYQIIKPCNTRKQHWFFNLISSKKLFLETHYRDHHPTNPDWDFIKENGYNCLYGTCRNPSSIGNGPLTNQVPGASLSLIQKCANYEKCKRSCSFTVSKKTPYANLQWAVDGTRYDPNQVLTKLPECHPDLSHQEFIEFGSLRCYHQLQLHNLYGALTRGSLSLKNDSVLNLISQAIYEAGPREAISDSVLRTPHQELSNAEFIQNLLSLIKETMDRHARNWKDNYILLTLITLLNRIVSAYGRKGVVGQQNPDLHSTILEKGVDLLSDCRSIGIDWAKTVDDVLANLVDAPRQEIDNLRLKLIEINVCIAQTFNIRSNDTLHQIIGVQANMVTWIYSIVKIYDNLVLILSGQSITREKLLKQQPTLQNLLRRVQETGHYLEGHLTRKLQNFCEPLNDFSQSYYTASRELFQKHGKPDWTPFPDCPSVYYGNVITDNQNELLNILLEVDISTGSFRVNGCPVSYLPTNIESHPDFQRTFPAKSFEVQPYKYQAGRVITRSLHLGSSYSFYIQSDGSLIITEHLDGGKTRQLVPHQFLKGNVPYSLVHDYTHWVTFKKSTSKGGRTTRDVVCVEFFFRTPNEPSKLFTLRPSYRLDMETRRLLELETNKEIVCIRSQHFKHIDSILTTLEHYRHVLMYATAGNTPHYTVLLPRMGLQFDEIPVGTRIELWSLEFRGMKIAENQQIDTLIGLQNRLLLEDTDQCTNNLGKQNSILLIPHGTPIVCEDHNIVIDTKELRSPPFFAYEVDPRLKQLRGGESQAGWAYLSLLHGLTSSTPLPDPFTNVIGFERALQILQSGHCFSAEPYDDETLRTFSDILRLLVPSREYYPLTMKTMEQVKWPTSQSLELSPYISHEGYRLILDKLMTNSQSLAFLFPDSKLQEFMDKYPQLFTPPRSPDLITKAYWNRVVGVTELGRVSPDFDKKLTREPQFQPVPHYELLCRSEVVTHVLKLSQLVHRWTYLFPSSVAIYQLRQILFSGPNLKGVYREAPFPVNESIHVWADLCFRNHWLDLYKLARKVKAKKLYAEWAFILGQFAFRINDPVDMDQLLLLQLVAVNSEAFKKVDPPPHLEYSLTDVVDFDYQTMLAYMKDIKIPWEIWMDEKERAGEKFDWETNEDFLDRMQPEYDECVETQAKELTEILQKNWPIETCKQLFDAVAGDELAIDYTSGLQQINLWLSKWFQNRELSQFMNKVEDTVNEIRGSENGQSNYAIRGTEKHLLRGTSTRKQELESYCEHPKTFMMRMEDVIGSCNESNFKIHNHALYTELSQLYNSYSSLSNSNSQAPIRIPPPQPTQPFPFSLIVEQDPCPILREHIQDLKDSWNQYHNDVREPERKLVRNLSTLIDHSRWEFEQDLKDKRSKLWDSWEKIKEVFRPRIGDLDPVTRQLIHSELYPRITPLDLLKLLPTINSKSIGDIIGGFGVLLTMEQQATRIARYHKQYHNKEGRANRELHKLELLSELDNKGHENWIPSEKPEWLLFEIEMDLLVRKLQAQVADKMICPDGNKNALVQLNMGEGKTSVIVPLVLLALSNSTQLARVTVLKSLYQMNRKALTNKLGGLLLNRRCYAFPCCRDFKIEKKEARLIQKTYLECVKKKGFVITLPVYRLSFQLKAWERLGSGYCEDGREILKVEDWLNANARDILDESDEILNVKYQLVYTLGKQIPVGGGSLRWKICQKVLRLVPGIIEGSSSQFGTTVMELKTRKSPQKFHFVRVLQSTCYPTLCLKIAEAAMNGEGGIQIPELLSSRLDRKILLQFLTNQSIPKETFNYVFGKFPAGPHQETLLILRGILACGALSTALEKRWRVNYGVNPTGHRLMAVPFRAKDVATDRTEFGHPDVAILLSQLSYYYSGLTDEQIEHCFVLLTHETDPQFEYGQWISLLPHNTPQLNLIRNLSGVNLKDFYQRTKIIFPALRKNMNTIDFWLDKAVYPSESKQFGLKIGTTPWDLCPTRQNPTTGFSGTNDSKILLPNSISQQDLPELLFTNGKVLTKLLHVKNKYEKLEFRTTGQMILKKMVESGNTVLLDVGALMLELNNQQVGVEWLKLTEDDPRIDAAVYFDTNDKLVVLKRGQKEAISLELSTFCTRLDRCVIYLDDVHTRGTDLKIPPGVTGVVTIGKGVTKDKLVQGSMRMRKLGQGHQIQFWASKEVDDAIRALRSSSAQMRTSTNHEDSSNSISSADVLQWAIENSRQAIQDGFIHWAFAGVYQAQKLSANEIYKSSKKSDADCKLLSENCSLKETTELSKMYGEIRELQTLPTIVNYQLSRVEQELKKGIKSKGKSTTSFPTLENVATIVDSFGTCVKGHIDKYVDTLERPSNSIDEEQERELEHELEAQTERERPTKMKSSPHQTSLGVQNFIRYGSMVEIEKWALKLPLTLKSTKLWKEYPSDTWGLNVYASLDFATVAKLGPIASEQILRPVNWFCSVFIPEDMAATGPKRSCPSKLVLLLLSPYEVNHYWKDFEKSRGILHMYTSRLAPTQATLYENSALWRGSSESFRQFLANGAFSISSSTSSILALYSGSLFFGSEEEQDNYCCFLGFCLRPRDEKEEAAFARGEISHGFLLPGQSRELLGYSACRFDTHPANLIRGIIERRYGSFPTESHIGKMILHSVKPFTRQLLLNGKLTNEK